MEAFRTFGGYVVGSWVASILYGAALVQTVRYFHNFPDDHWLRKAIVTFAMLFGLVALIGDYSNVYLMLVTFWGDAGPKPSWTRPVYGTLNGTIGILVNAYLISRIWVLTKNIFIAVFLSTVVVLSLVMLLVGNILVGTTSDLTTPRGQLAHTAMKIWAISFTFLDFAISGILVMKLRSMKSSFQSTNNMIHCLIVGAVRTGLTTALITLFLLAFFLVDSSTSVPPMFHSMLGPASLHTLFANLLSRRLNSSGPSGASRTTSDSRPNMNNTIMMDGIQVHRTAIVTIDPPEDVGLSTRMDIESVGKEDAESYSGQKVVFD
ncbi:hypothetical protein MIND_00380200 [Mycena indigotica]|uniref:DUF6534 domain-containing protein n=1 Tax=Mycena indigotica TaxID=2126181 RepID=A0A8H6T148_9AGAR|nr:uncharacterized protein MIND_00380200 [Mycena indigotica]KAF7310070.1 hypothetical protein MIND_00380200 [Mycena indigotica]